MSNGGDCRTAPATPGPLNIVAGLVRNKINKNKKLPPKARVGETWKYTYMLVLEIDT